MKSLPRNDRCMRILSMPGSLANHRIVLSKFDLSVAACDVLFDPRSGRLPWFPFIRFSCE